MVFFWPIQDSLFSQIDIPATWPVKAIHIIVLA